MEPNGTERKRDKYVFGQSQHGFHATVGAVVVTCLFCGEMPLRNAWRSTLTDSAARLIVLALFIASWHPRGEDPVCLFETAHSHTGGVMLAGVSVRNSSQTRRPTSMFSVAMWRNMGLSMIICARLCSSEIRCDAFVWCPCCSIACVAGHVLASMSFSGKGMSFSISYMPIEDLPTRRQSREVSCFTAFARLDVPTT